MTPIIEIKDLSASYDGKTVLKEVFLKIYPHDFLGIIGPNGGGKTTLIKTILGLKKHDTGTIHYFKGDKKVANLKMGYLPQYNLIDKEFPISVEEVILSGLSSEKKLTARYSREDKLKAKNTIERMGLTGFEKRSIGKLSGGQLQRALLGRAIIANPSVLILDEPSTYIDKKFEAKLYELLAEIKKQCAIVLVSHDIGTVLQQVETIACVNETLDYHPSSGVTSEWIEKNFHCPIELLGFGSIPHRVLPIDTNKQESNS